MSRSSSKKNSRVENRITVILIRGMGNLRTYNLSVFWFRLAGAVIICLTLAVALLGYQTYTLRQDRQKLVSQLFLDGGTKAVGEQNVQQGSLDQDQTDSSSSETEEDKQASQEEDKEQSPEREDGSKAGKPDGPPQTPATAKTDKGEAAPDQATDKPEPAPAPKAAASADSSEAEPNKTAEKEEDQPPAAAKTAPEKEAAKPAAASEAKPEADAARLAAAVAENLAEDRLDPNQMELDNVKTMRLAQPQGIKISYKIKNLIGGGRRISGYAFIIGLNSKKQPVKAFPAEAVLDEDKPVNFKQGRYFYIRQYTTIRGRIYTDDEISYIKILVYDLTGQLVMAKQFDADDA